MSRAGLARADMNGRTGVVVKAFDAESARVTVLVDPKGDLPGLTARFRPENLRILVVDARPTVPIRDAAPEASVVLATCHAVVAVEGAGLVGDPIELTALQVCAHVVCCGVLWCAVVCCGVVCCGVLWC